MIGISEYYKVIRYYTLQASAHFIGRKHSQTLLPTLEEIVSDGKTSSLLAKQACHGYHAVFFTSLTNLVPDNTTLGVFMFASVYG